MPIPVDPEHLEEGDQGEQDTHAVQNNSKIGYYN